ncbi:RagB/SusD family nutrient uptake outer membrane protein [uncultured Chitinophaga sp.]|jgi:SusD family.|uniref:RagB/SusD family nutrient uptake outer membrane protein n=1 Tax=uncultured Chitinophaga sp. TaxID=339340 RepID=UPI00262805F9|nr:RagB/SusD family nutrient uptake outer membrane protein [uncultured Chitinophaga sp.]
MKRNRHIPLRFVISLLLLTAAACNSKLDVKPGQHITPDEIRTAADVKAVLFGAYKSMQDFNAFGERYILIPDLLGSAGQVSFVGTFTEYRDIFNKAQVAQSLIAQGIWQRSYVTINGANVVLSKLDLLDAAEKDAVEGEARFVRALTYYELVNLFGQPYSAGNIGVNEAVPLVLEPTTVYDPEKDNKPRATVDAVYKQIVSDLTAAAATLPASYSDNNGRATKYAAQALLSKVYMAQARYTEAATAATEVISEGGFSLAATFDKAFNNVSGSTEDIFAMLQTDQSNGGSANSGLTTMYAAYNATPMAGRGDVRVDTNLYKIYGEHDDRRAFIYEGTGIAGGIGEYSRKWKDFYRAIPVIRLADIYLIRAEANARAGATIGGKTPLEDVNTVRVRAHAAALATVTAEQVVEERFRELAFEGDWLWTRKRLKMNIGTRSYNDPKMVLPVPQRERDVNELLSQNPGYDN